MPERGDEERERDVVRPVEELEVVAAHPVLREHAHAHEEREGRDEDEVDREVVRERDLHLDRKDVVRERVLLRVHLPPEGHVQEDLAEEEVAEHAVREDHGLPRHAERERPDRVARARQHEQAEHRVVQLAERAREALLPRHRADRAVVEAVLEHPVQAERDHQRDEEHAERELAVAQPAQAAGRRWSATRSAGARWLATPTSATT